VSRPKCREEATLVRPVGAASGACGREPVRRGQLDFGSLGGADGWADLPVATLSSGWNRRLWQAFDAEANASDDTSR
jgi:hypothetical protein